MINVVYIIFLDYFNGSRTPWKEGFYMSKQQTLEDIQQAIRGKYAEVSHSSKGIFSYPTGEKGANLLGYNLSEFTYLPKELLESFCGVGNPFSLGPIKKGESILDIGCGAGFDLFVASTRVGKNGKVYGIDLTPEMVMKAKDNLQQASCHAQVQVGSSEAIPFDTDTFDVVTSNGVLNLSPLKEKSFKEIYRVLKPGGQLQFADIILKEKLPEEITGNLDAWSN